MCSLLDNIVSFYKGARASKGLGIHGDSVTTYDEMPCILLGLKAPAQ